MLRRLMFALALGLVLIPMLMPASDVPSSNDKVDHFVTFAALALIGVWARVRPWPLLAVLSAYAVLTEVLQATLTSTRHGDPHDVLADVCGAATVLIALWCWRRLLGLRTAR